MPKTMPYGVGPESGTWGPAHWLGRFLRGGVDAVGAEAEFLQSRMQGASAEERTAWVQRFLIGSLIVVCEYYFLYRILDRRDSAVAFMTSWVSLFLLPRPVPRLILLAGRSFAFVTTITVLSVGLDTAALAIPTIGTWNGLIWFAAMSVLLVWTLAALRPRGPIVAIPQPSSTVPVAVEANFPKVRHQDVGGADSAKREISLVASNRFQKNGKGIVRNGVLLYGPQGTGKNLLAEATAGEFGAKFVHVRCPELLGSAIGSTAAHIRQVFEEAAQRRPVVLFLDEVDAIGSKKQAQGTGTDTGGGGREHNAVTTQLMQSIDKYRSIEGLMIVAATNSLDGLEPTLIREGRFDVKLRLDLPDQAGREAILSSILKRSGPATTEIVEIARRTPGWSPARLRALVDRAMLQARGATATDSDVLATLEESGGHDRPQVEVVNWDQVVLPGPVVSDIKTILRLLSPGTADQLGVHVPSGLVLVGRPGMGKTLVARLIASQAKRSFYAITPSDVLSGSVGGSVKRVSELFARAREHAPAILFFDEMDALFPVVTGYGSQHDVQLVEQALIEISDLRPEHQVFLIGTTNDLSRVDPRILRGGRFSEKVEIGLPDDDGYRRLVSMNFPTIQLSAVLTEMQILEMVRGLSPAEISAVASAARRFALARTPEGATRLMPIEANDIELAIARVR
jgi:transitional endoplasmic reticulum ATPase